MERLDLSGKTRTELIVMCEEKYPTNDGRFNSMNGKQLRAILYYVWRKEKGSTK